MPELPDVTVYVEAFQRQFVDQVMHKVLVRSPFLLRSFEHDVSELEGKRLLDVSRLGKRIIWHMEDDLHAVFHLMIAGRFHLRKPGTSPRGKNDLAAFQFLGSTVMLTEASTKKRASLHIVQGVENLAEHNPQGLEVMAAGLDEFRQRLLSEKRTLKRSLTSPRLFSGIGNAYSDEILHAARLSPVRRTDQLNDDEIERLFEAMQRTLDEWTQRLRKATGKKFPEKVTAFRPEMAVHGKFKEPCPVCGSPVQRIVFAENETNYCATCQTGGKVLKDRSLSRLLKDDWPRSIEEWEEQS